MKKQGRPKNICCVCFLVDFMLKVTFSIRTLYLSIDVQKRNYIIFPAVRVALLYYFRLSENKKHFCLFQVCPKSKILIQPIQKITSTTVSPHLKDQDRSSTHPPSRAPDPEEQLWCRPGTPTINRLLDRQVMPATPVLTRGNISAKDVGKKAKLRMRENLWQKVSKSFDH